MVPVGIRRRLYGDRGVDSAMPGGKTNSKIHHIVIFDEIVAIFAFIRNVMRINILILLAIHCDL